MVYMDEYRKKLVPAGEAVKCVSSGDTVDYGFFNGKPVVCDMALAGRAAELRDVSIYTAVTVPPVPEVIKYPESFRYMDWQWSKLTRIMHSQFEVAYYSPILYHRAPFAYRYLLNQDSTENLNKGYRSVNYDKPQGAKTKWISIVRVAPMDKSGFFNLGPQNSETSAKIEGADYVIVEVVKNMPICLGGSEEAVHISRVDYIVEAPDDHGCYATPDIPPSDIDKQIAGHVMRYIHDGCCIQLGIGGMPNMVGKLIAQSDLKNLGCHTEMFVDAYADMIESGRMDGSKKNLDRFKATYTFAIGSQRMYDFMNNNPALASFPVDYTNDPKVIAQIDNMVSICNAVQVDLFSQVNAESRGSGQISGNGGMWDFVLGSQWSKGGKSFICLASTHTNSKGEKISRIVPGFTPGTTTTIPRQMVDYIVTEYGAVKLTMCPTWMRAEKIISVAHPDFREDLIKEAERMKIWIRSNKK
jgi:acyl-CoA hydrolase